MGIPIGEPFQRPEPKSGWRPMPGPIVLTIAEEFDATGSESTRTFHQLFEGKIEQAGALGNGRLFADDAPSRSASATTGTRRTTRVMRDSSAAWVGSASTRSGIPVPSSDDEPLGTDLRSRLR